MGWFPRLHSHLGLRLERTEEGELEYAIFSLGISMLGVYQMRRADRGPYCSINTGVSRLAPSNANPECNKPGTRPPVIVSGMESQLRLESRPSRDRKDGSSVQYLGT